MKKSLQLLCLAFLAVMATGAQNNVGDEWALGDYMYRVTGINDGGVTGTLDEVEVARAVTPGAVSNVVIPGTADNGDFAYTVTGIGDGAFSAGSKGAGANPDNAAVVSVVLPPSVTRFNGAHHFRNNPNLTTINLENIVSIGSNTFVACSGLTGVINLPVCTDMGAYAFFDCHNITGVNIPVAETFGAGGLYNMDGVREFDVPSSVNAVGNLFLGDTGGANILEQVQLNWDATQLAAVAFANDSKFFRGEWLPNGVEGDDFVDTTVKIYVPVGSKAAYEAHPSWGKFPSANIIEGAMPELPVLSTNKAELALGLSLYPNPTNDFVNIASKTITNLDVTVYDINGRTLLNTTQSRVDISSLSAGLYIFRVKTDAGELVKRILKN
ncbi:T9SS type A sorting domain-containing protein [Algibacter mikhailovii]|uniref:T9SS type A sorting domain-containing protein n=1 Tax=Algibacter mikhailovii TaxID=425498 RepID=UPI0024954BD7|nr:T9SS type A sorting domain-containing protein [Algibacter mikhailovii]